MLLKQLRRNLFNNKRYILYALGEFLLIVAGILVALQVDNWREQIANEKKIKQYYSLLVNDLQDQLVEIDAQMHAEQEIVQQAEMLLKQYDINKGFIADSAYYHTLGNINKWRTFTKIDPVYAQLLATGDVGLIQNSTLKQDVFAYYHQLHKIEAVITENHSYLINSFSPLILRVSDHRLPVPISGKSYLENFIQQTLDRNEVRLELFNAIKFRYHLAIVNSGYLEELRQRSVTLKNALTQEL